MKIQILTPTSSTAERYPKRAITEEFEVDDLSEVLEEKPAPDFGWMTARTDATVLHFTADRGKWQFRSMTHFGEVES